MWCALPFLNSPLNTRVFYTLLEPKSRTRHSIIEMANSDDNCFVDSGEGNGLSRTSHSPNIAKSWSTLDILDRVLHTVSQMMSRSVNNPGTEKSSVLRALRLRVCTSRTEQDLQPRQPHHHQSQNLYHHLQILTSKQW